jgi:hypothetical protein
MRTVLWKAAAPTRRVTKVNELQLAQKIRQDMALVSFAMLASLLPSIALGQAPVTPPAITPPQGNKLFLKTHATGTQNYICLPSTNGGGNTWVFFSPQATLSPDAPALSNEQVLTHFLSSVPQAKPSPVSGCTVSKATGALNCPTWQSSSDLSAVWGGKIGSINGGTDASCHNNGAIPCLLLNAVATGPGRGGSNVLTKTTFIQRLNTNGGAAPAASCQVGDQALVPYTADYLFYTSQGTDSRNGDAQ